eukprot:3259951-Pyramimonas_sp.AAC.1
MEFRYGFRRGPARLDKDFVGGAGSRIRFPGGALGIRIRFRAGHMEFASFLAETRAFQLGLRAGPMHFKC